MVGVKNPIPGVVYKSPEELAPYVDAGVLGDRTLAGALRDAFSQFSDRIALSDADGAMTYGELDQTSDQLALALHRLGLEPLDRVVFQLPNSREVVIALLACWKANFLPLCTLDAHRDAEIGYLGKHANAVAHLIRTDKDNFDFAKFARRMKAEHIPSMRHIIVARGTAPEDMESMQSLVDAVDPDEAADFVQSVDFDPYQVCAFQLSGGTTSIPKIIPQMSNSYLHAMDMMAARLNYRADDVIFMPLPMIHNAAMLCYLFPGMLRGAEFAIASSTEPREILRVMTTRKPTWFALAGAALPRLIAAGAKEMLDLDRVRGVFSQSSARQIEEALGVKGLHLFGMTEGMLIFPSEEDPQAARFATLGRPISPMDEVRIVFPETEEDVPFGETGELLIKGPYSMAGYYDAPERNREIFTSDGFVRSGDLISAHEFNGEAYYTFQGRTKDVVSRGGEKINCEEVEMAARRHPDIADIAIVPMPDPEYDERACAYMICPPGATPPTVGQLAEFLTGAGLAKFKCPERIEVVQDFPSTKSGKLSKPTLKTMIANTLEEEARSDAGR